MSIDIVANSLILLPLGDAAMTVGYDLSGLAGSSQTAMTFSHGMHVAVDQNAPDPDFPDNIVHVIGWNTGANGERADTDKAGFSWRMERSYRDGGKMGFESHWQLVDESGTLIRPVSAFAAHDGSRVGLTSQVHKFSVEHPAAPETGQFAIDFANDAVTLVGLSLVAANNTPVARQLNATGSALISLPYISNLNAELHSVPIHQVTASAVDPNGNRSYVYRNLLTPGPGYYGEFVELNAAVTGAFIQSYFAGSASTNIRTLLMNSHATGGVTREVYSTAGSIQDFFSIGASSFGAGMRASDGAFCASPSGSLDDAGLVIRQNGRVAIPSVPPASAGASGKTGDITWDSSFIYVCVATDTWKRAALATW